MEDPLYTKPFYKRLITFLDASGSESDRGRVLIAASLIEEMLGEVLKAFLLENSGTRKLFDEANAPLSTLSAKISACHAMGLISGEEFRDIEIVRKIRNAFAHSVLCSFDDNRIGDQARAMKVGMHQLDALEKGHTGRVDDPRARFSMVATSLVMNFYNRAHFVRSKKLQEQDWPH